MTEEPFRYLPGAPSWTHLLAHSLSTSERFYGRLFGWEFAPGAERLGPYVRALLDAREVAGIGVPAPGRQTPVAWLPYLATDDADATAEQVRLCGGTVGVGPLDAGEDGRMALATDPAGAPFGIWQSRRSPGGAEVTGPGTPVWVELITPDAWAAASFYAEVFDYDNKPRLSEEFDAITLHVDGRPVGGIQGVGDRLPPGRGPHWLVYFEVADVQRAVARVVELGGQVAREPRTTPLGRVAVVVDAEGALFAIVEPAKRPTASPEAR